MSDTRVIAVSMAGKAPILAMATVTKTGCHFAKLENLPRTITALHEKLSALKNSAKKLNADLVIEDTTGIFRCYGRPLNLGDRDWSGKPVIVQAMERYTNLEQFGALTFPHSDKSRFSIPTSMYNVKQHDNGSISYEINWQILRDEARIMLLVIHSGFCQTVFSKGFLSKMLGNIAGGHSCSAPQWLKDEDDPAYKNGSGARVMEL